MTLLRYLALFTAVSLSVSAQADLPPTATPDMLSLRDPFRRPNISVEAERPRSELETFPADQLKMLGMLTGPRKLKALVQAPNGKTYFVTLNTPVGLRGGRITRITDDSIQIREKVVNLLGQQEDLDTVVHLAAEQHAVSLEASAADSTRSALTPEKIREAMTSGSLAPSPPVIPALPSSEGSAPAGFNPPGMQPDPGAASGRLGPSK